VNRTPLQEIEVVQLAGCVIVLIFFVSPISGSVSFVRTEIIVAVSSFIVTESFTATGVSLIQFTVTETVHVFETNQIASLIVYVKLSVPQKLATGVYRNLFQS
jgi:hypothetical protein